ncbi:MAG: hypothetical protein ABH828_02785 [archaeon]
MKKLLFILVLIFLSVQALAIETVTLDLKNTTNPRPTITVEYKETVNIIDYSLTKNLVKYNISYSTLNDKKFEFIPENRLNNGLYMLTIVAEDLVGNSLQINQPIEITRESMDIWAVIPHLGVSNTSVFNVTLQSEESGECKAKLNTEGPIDFAIGYPLVDSEDKLTHVIEDFGTSPFTFSTISEDNGGMERTIRAECKDDTGLIHYQNIYLAYDNTPPTIEARFDPARVIDVGEPFAILKVNVNDRSICSYKEEGSERINFDGYDAEDFSAYKKTHNATIDFSYLKNRGQPAIFEEVTVNFTVECTNLAGFTVSRNITGKIAFEKTFSIEMVQPGPSTNKASVDFIVKTSVGASCKYGEGNNKVNWTNDFTSITGNKLFSVNLGPLSKGSYTYGVACTGITEQEKAFTFKVDRSGPSNVTVVMTDPTCTLSSIEGEISADDDDEIAYYNYSITNLTSEKTTSGKIDKRVNLEDGKKYTINVKAYDRAGNAADGTDTFTASNNSLTECDLKDPYSQLTVNKTDDGVLATIQCFDGDSGCKSRFDYGTASSLGNCSPDKGRDVGDALLITFDTYLCWTVYDNNENENSNSEFIDVITSGDEYPDYCFNGDIDGTETDIDCGGECTKCATGNFCENDNDCTTDFCIDNICETEQDENTTDDDGDKDNDGLPDDWEERYGLDPDDPTDADKDLDGDGYTNLEEYEKGTDPTDSTDKPSSNDTKTEPYIPPEEKSNFFGWSFIILGILLIITGIVLLLLESRKKEKESIKFSEPRLIDNKIKTINTEESIEADEEKKEEKTRTRKEYGAMFKKRSKEKKNARKELLKEFDSNSKKDTTAAILLKIDDELKKKEKAEKDISILSEEETSNKKESKKEKKELEDQNEFKEENIGEDVFQELEDIKKETSSEETDESDFEVVSVKDKKKKEKEDLKKLEKKVEEIKSKEKPEEKADNEELDTDDVFKKLSELSGQSHEVVKKAVSKAEDSSEDLLRVFANVTSKKQIDTNVFKAILSQLLEKGHISKHVVATMLFEFLDQELLTHKEVSGLIRDLNLTTK